MIKVNVPADKIGKFEGKWVVIDPKNEFVIAVGDTLHDIKSLVVHSMKDKKALANSNAPFAYLVPRKDEGPYIL